MSRSLILTAGMIAIIQSIALADGGKPKNSEQWLNNRVTVFIAPDPVRVGPMEVSVMIQDLQTGNTRTDLKMTVYATPMEKNQPKLGGEANSDHMTNKLMIGRIINIPEEGKWQIAVQIEGKEGLWRKLIPVEVFQPMPQWLEYATYIAWPAAAIMIFMLHRTIVRKRTRGRQAKLLDNS